MNATPNKPEPIFLPPAGVRLASPSVDIARIDLALQTFLVVAGLVHLHLFDERLVVQAGRGKGHTPGDAHGLGRAIDVEIGIHAMHGHAAFLSNTWVLCGRFGLLGRLMPTTGIATCVHIEVNQAG